MNAIIISAVCGVIMMFGGVFIKKNSSIRILAEVGLLILLISNCMDMGGNHFFPINTHNMLYFDSFGLLFNCIAFGSTLIYFLLSARDIENVGINIGEYFALIFFVL